ncbi:hypothetical protein [Halalkalibaculum sp. DA384]|uniref:hypothetical protein n=1 Tax=Halalkalibaculum sp. DA384 TaxID=3373606 RepID=UPI0037541247
MDVAPVRTLIAGNLRNGPSTSTPAQAAAGAPFSALSFWFLLGQAKRDTSVGEIVSCFTFRLLNHLSLFIFSSMKKRTKKIADWGFIRLAALRFG